MNIAIIGAGIGGLAAAIRMAAKGHKVTVYEKNNIPGGKLSQYKHKGYRFDTGPSLFTLPQLVDELYELSGKKPEEHFSYTHLPVICRYFYPDETEFVFYQDLRKLEEELQQKTGEDPKNLKKHLQKAREAYQISSGVFLFNSLHKLSNYTTEPYKKVLFKLHKLDFFRTMHHANRKRFTNPKLVQLFDRYATYNGSDPYRAPATLNMIAHLENNIGAFFPQKGMYSLAENLYDLAVEKGVEFRFNTEVQEIILQGRQATGLMVNGNLHTCDILISDADVRYVARHMLKHPLRKRMERLEPSSSALIFYWGIRHEFPKLDLHNILFGNDYKTEFRKLFKEQNIHTDPTVYIFISSKLVPGDAPTGCENWFVMVNAPANTGQNWEELSAIVRRNIIGKINRMLQTDIEKYIEFEKVASPVTIEKETNSIYGALYGNSSNSILAAFLRHPNFLRSIKNLYFVGGSVHPGGGIPLCLASAKIVDKEIPYVS